MFSNLLDTLSLYAFYSKLTSTIPGNIVQVMWLGPLSIVDSLTVEARVLKFRKLDSGAVRGGRSNFLCYSKKKEHAFYL